MTESELIPTETIIALVLGIATPKERAEVYGASLINKRGFLSDSSCGGSVDDDHEHLSQSCPLVVTQRCIQDSRLVLLCPFIDTILDVVDRTFKHMDRVRHRIYLPFFFV